VAEEDVTNRAARVTRTGIALVHEGELILPAAGSEAEAEQVVEDARAVVNYYFPVEIEVRAAPDPVDPEDLIQQTLARLAQSLESI
jgi:hypothetical protein